MTTKSPARKCMDGKSLNRIVASSSFHVDVGVVISITYISRCYSWQCVVLSNFPFFLVRQFCSMDRVRERATPRVKERLYTFSTRVIKWRTTYYVYPLFCTLQSFFFSLPFGRLAHTSVKRLLWNFVQ